MARRVSKGMHPLQKPMLKTSHVVADELTRFRMWLSQRECMAEDCDAAAAGWVWVQESNGWAYACKLHLATTKRLRVRFAHAA